LRAKWKANSKYAELIVRYTKWREPDDLKLSLFVCHVVEGDVVIFALSKNCLEGFKFKNCRQEQVGPSQ
jgi:hypothetical protein